MRSSRSLRQKKRIFGERKPEDFRKKFQQYRPVRFEQDDAQTERKTYGDSQTRRSKVNLTCINYGEPPKKRSEANDHHNHLLRHPEELKSFLHRIKTDESPLKQSSVVNSSTVAKPHLKPHQQVIRFENAKPYIAHPSPSSYDNIINEKNKPLLKSILKELLAEIKPNHNEKIDVPEPLQAEVAKSACSPKAKQLNHVASNQNCLAIIRDIRSQINDMLGTLHIT